MTRASTVLGAAPHPRGRCAAVPPTTVCPERPFRRPERPVRPSSWRDTMGLGIGQPRGSLCAWRKTRRLRAPRGAAARRGSQPVVKRWLKIHQDAEDDKLRILDACDHNQLPLTTARRPDTSPGVPSGKAAVPGPLIASLARRCAGLSSRSGLAASAPAPHAALVSPQ